MGEIVLSYRATRKTRIDYNDFERDDAVEFVLPTPEAVSAGVESARRMGGRLAGVVFFRWPGGAETLTLQPQEVLRAAGVAAQTGGYRTRMETVDGECAAVHCVDLYLENAQAFSPKPLQYRIHSSVELEYFLPEANLPVRMTGAGATGIVAAGVLRTGQPLPGARGDAEAFRIHGRRGALR